jgi:methionyl-tRNA synthetase
MSDIPAPPAAPVPAKPEPKPQIAFDEFAKVDLRIAKILQAENHPSADRLFKLQVDDGSGTPRQICAGIRGFYTAEQLVGRLIVIVANLAPRMLRGEESRGMLLAASDAGKQNVILLTPASEIAPGAIVS